MPEDKEKSEDSSREVKDTTKPSSETNTKTETSTSTRAPGVPAPQKGGPEAPADSPSKA